jgi:hypothetical protein
MGCHPVAVVIMHVNKYVYETSTKILLIIKIPDKIQQKNENLHMFI